MKIGKRFVITTLNNTSENCFVQSASLNGQFYNNNYINISDIFKGGEFNFQLNNVPNKEWGSSAESLPYSLSREEKY